MSQFLHDVSNIVAIIHGKTSQADRLAHALADSESTQAVQEKLAVVLKEIERLQELIRIEKINHSQKTG